MQKPTLLILAAGMGSRYGGLKQLDHIGPNGETIIDYSVYDAIKYGFGKVVFVIRQSFEQEFKEQVVSKFSDKIQVELVFQSTDTGFEEFPCPTERTKPWGTGHAILCAKDVIDEPFISINADDYYGPNSFEKSALFLLNNASETNYAMVGYRLKNTLSKHGTVSRGVCELSDGNLLTDVEEHTGIQQNDEIINAVNFSDEAVELNAENIVSMNYWAFHPSIFKALENKFKTFLGEKINTPKSEFYIPFVVNEMIKEKIIDVKVLASEDQWFGVTYKEDKEQVTTFLEALSEKGRYPSPLWKNKT